MSHSIQSFVVLFPCCAARVFDHALLQRLWLTLAQDLTLPHLNLHLPINRSCSMYEAPGADGWCQIFSCSRVHVAVTVQPGQFLLGKTPRLSGAFFMKGAFGHNLHTSACFLGSQRYLRMLTATCSANLCYSYVTGPACCADSLRVLCQDSSGSLVQPELSHNATTMITRRST